VIGGVVGNGAGCAIVRWVEINGTKLSSKDGVTKVRRNERRERDEIMVIQAIRRRLSLLISIRQADDGGEGISGSSVHQFSSPVQFITG
jgi:hypothetical protein